MIFSVKSSYEWRKPPTSVKEITIENNKVVFENEKPTLGFTMPFSSRAMIEVLAWRELKVIDHQLNVVFRIGAVASILFITVASLIEGLARLLFTCILSPMALMRDDSKIKYFSFLKGNKVNLITPFFALELLYRSLFKAAVLVDNVNPLLLGEKQDDWIGHRKSKLEWTTETNALRDAFRGNFYKAFINVDQKKISFSPIKV